MTELAEIPRVKTTAGEPVPDLLVGEVLRRFNDAGVMIFDDVIPPDRVAALHGAYTKAYAEYHQDREFDDALFVGDKRTMITVGVSGVFNDPLIYAHPVLFPFVRLLLGEDVILGSFVAVTSLPGSEDQEMHLDVPLLYGVDEIGASIPSYCLTLVLPLVDMNTTNGSTMFYPGSHRAITADVPDGSPVVPEVAVGSALLFDVRVWHGGTANRSSAPRPVLYHSYHRPWFRDSVNFAQQVPLNITAEELAHVPEAHRHLFDWVTEPTL